jgi:glycosyltransferase 2 family protein
LAPMGIVGGDLLKAVMLGREHPGYRARAVASVILDRLIGLYALFVVASTGILLTGFWRLPILQWHLIVDINLCQIVLVLTAIGAAGIGLLLVPAVTSGRWVASLARLPRVGTAIHSLVDAMRIYRSNLPVLLAAIVMSVGVHCLFTISIYLVARGLPGDVLPLSTQFVVYPISSVASTLPLPAGPFEAVLEFLYTHVPGSPIPKGQGLVVALVFRLMAILLALVGFCYYMGSRREVAEVMHEAETEEAAGESVWADAALEPGAGLER